MIDTIAWITELVLWRYAKYKGMDISSGGTMEFTRYSDDETISSYAVPAIKRTVAEGMIQGDNKKFAHAATAPRSQIPAILHRFCLLREEE